MSLCWWPQYSLLQSAVPWWLPQEQKVMGSNLTSVTHYYHTPNPLNSWITYVSSWQLLLQYWPGYWRQDTKAMVLKMWYWIEDIEVIILKTLYWSHDTEIMILKTWYWRYDTEVMILKSWYWSQDTEVRILVIIYKQYHTSNTLESIKKKDNYSVWTCYPILPSVHPQAWSHLVKKNTWVLLYFGPLSIPFH